MVKIIMATRRLVSRVGRNQLNRKELLLKKKMAIKSVVMKNPERMHKN